jgi:hypothetical protein
MNRSESLGFFPHCGERRWQIGHGNFAFVVNVDAIEMQTNVAQSILRQL